MVSKTGRAKSVSYAKWGYIFLAPFFIAFTLFTLAPMFNTFYNALFENYMSGLKQVGPNYVGLANFVKLFTDAKLGTYMFNTLWIWLLGFIPQIVVALLLASWLTDARLKIRAQGFFKTIIYMPNLIMASTMAMLFFALFSDGGPINNIMASVGIEPYRFTVYKEGVRGLIAFMNFLLWFGNTTIILMAGVLGIDPQLFEAAEIDGASALQSFWRVTIPLLRPILAYTLITCLIGGIQMFDVPQVLTKGVGTPDRTSMTLMMLLNNYMSKSSNFGLGGALSTVLFGMTAALSYIIFHFFNRNQEK